MRAMQQQTIKKKTHENYIVCASYRGQTEVDTTYGTRCTAYDVFLSISPFPFFNLDLDCKMVGENVGVKKEVKK